MDAKICVSARQRSADNALTNFTVIKYLNSQECRGRPMLEKIFALAREKFKDELMFEIDENTLRRNLSPHWFACAAYDTETEEVVSFFTWIVTDTRFRDGLVSGRMGENDVFAYDGTYPPVLYFNTFVVTNALHSPYIIRHLIKDLQALVKADHLNIVGGLSIGGLRFTEKWLKKYGFHEIGRYKDNYPILWADRNESAVLNSLCGRTKAFTPRPW